MGHNSGNLRAVAPSLTWTVSLNTVSDSTSVNGNTVTKPTTHFILFNATFHNSTNDAQVLAGQVFILKDDSGQLYAEDQASKPGTQFTVPPRQSVVLDTAYVVPNAVCSFHLVVVLAHAPSQEWDITSHYPGCV
jgi:hypothetical protein